MSSPRTCDTHTCCRAIRSGAVTTCFYDLGLTPPGFEHPSFRMWIECSIRLRPPAHILLIYAKFYISDILCLTVSHVAIWDTFFSLISIEFALDTILLDRQSDSYIHPWTSFAAGIIMWKSSHTPCSNIAWECCTLCIPVLSKVVLVNQVVNNNWVLAIKDTHNMHKLILAREQKGYKFLLKKIK